jgi:hypothetical protein
MESKQMAITTVAHQVAPARLLLDPNNYRFHDLVGYKPVANRNRYAEVGVQERALQLLQTTESFELGALKDSILTNGFVPLEQIVVERFDETENPKFVVIEGNRRVAAVKSLLSDHEAGAVDIEEEILQTLQTLPVIEMTGSEAERRDYQQTLMAIRHIAGIREWGPYQQAKLVLELYEKEKQPFGTVAQRIGISSREVARRYRASKALQQMEDDEEFGEHAAPRLYSFFHEAVSQPKVREWLGLSEQTYRAENDSARRAFYELLSPQIVEDQTLPPKLQNANRQVRLLKDIVDKPIPLQILLDPEKTFDDAVRAAQEETVEDETGVLEHSLGIALHALRRPSIDTWLAPTEQAQTTWTELVGLVEKVKPLMEKK